ncbi:TetR/AcrR family transcriptional regulator [Nocardia sp. CNY236]|uniref:TetR/AcrR family transcriptional regulator n=1 Tax=Nocardia sp. CNY236 TaxID=1169152 RepID=UPI0004138177|nr:TetR/AcrR family transcriptional regulator [Nocardia sp. CNY236]
MPGRPGQGRKFDYDTALDRAMHAFWQSGYEGTSIAQLTREMGINPPSLYASFGGKEDIFFAAIDRYNATRGSFLRRAFDEIEHSPALIRRLLFGAARAYAPDGCPGGCLIINSAVTVSDGNQHVADRLRTMRNANIDLLRERLAADRAGQRIPEEVDPRAVAEFVGAVIQGMSQRARDGADHETLRGMAATACSALPFGR